MLTQKTDGNPRPEMMRKVTSYGLMMGYINNKMNLIRMMVEHPEIQRPASVTEKARDWLRDILGHFSFDVSTEIYFGKLSEILARWPNISSEDTRTALSCIEGILAPFYNELPLYDKFYSIECGFPREGLLRDGK